MTAGSTVEVHHLLEGPEDAPVLVLSNSLGTTLAMWVEQALSERLRLLRYDQRGHGGSPVPPGPYTIEDLVRDSIPGASLEVIPDAAHLANIERPEAITQAILDHLGPVVGEGR